MLKINLLLVLYGYLLLWRLTKTKCCPSSTIMDSLETFTVCYTFLFFIFGSKTEIPNLICMRGNEPTPS